MLALALSNVLIWSFLVVALLNYKLFTEWESVPIEILSLVATINLVLLFACVGAFRLLRRTTVVSSRDDDQRPRCLDGQLIRSELSTTCPICLEAINGGLIFLTPCQHKFHPHCLQECLENAIHQCPICRQPISSVSNDPTTPPFYI